MVPVHRASGWDRGGEGAATAAAAATAGGRAVISKERMVSALTTTIKMVCGIEQVGDRA